MGSYELKHSCMLVHCKYKVKTCSVLKSGFPRAVFDFDITVNSRGKLFLFDILKKGIMNV